MQTYSFKNVSLQIDGRNISDYADGDDVITVARRGDAASDVVGADGKMAVAIHADQSGTFKFKIKQTSGDSGFLYSIVNAMQAGAILTPIAVILKDARRDDLATGVLGYIQKPSDMVRGKGINLQEWTLVVESLNISQSDLSGALGILNAAGNIFGA